MTLRNTAEGQNISLQTKTSGSNQESLKVHSGGNVEVPNGNLIVSGTVDGVDIAARDSVLTSTTTTANAALPKAGGTMTGDLNLNDSVKAKFGTGNDLQIYHDSSNSYIDDNGTGDFDVRTNGAKLSLKRVSDGHEGLRYTPGDSILLKYDNNNRLETSNAGISVTGGITVTGTVDGRDVAADGTKLDGIASGATNVTNNNQLTNGAGYITSVSGNISQLTNNAGYVTSSGVTSVCLLYTSPSPRDRTRARMPSSA